MTYADVKPLVLNALLPLGEVYERYFARLLDPANGEFDIVMDLKSVLNKTLYDKLIENSFYYAPPYLPVYGLYERN